jgi:hypothetical protein
MQLNNKNSIRAALAAATCTVLSQPLQASQSNGDDWDVRSALLYYSEANRVTVVEPVVEASKQTESGGSLTVRGIFDSLTGASPNGATPTNTAQTFTSPSGNDTYTTPAGEQPKRDLKDIRLAFGVDWESELSRLVRNTVSGNISTESDYFSLGVSDTLRRDFNNRQTTVAAGFGVTLDNVSPQGGVPVGLQLLSAPAPVVTGDGEGDDGMRKTTFDVLFGITQIINRRTLTQLNYSHTMSNGYLTDPYKVLSVVDPTTGATLDYRYEKRPDTRNSDALYWKLQYHLPQDVVYFSYRYFQDDWGIRSHTTDLKYRYELGSGKYLQPHYRYYKQTAADFFRHSLVDGATVPATASADLRLADMTGTTVGVKFGMPLYDGEFSIRFEKMLQTGESHPADAIGIQKNYDLYPNLDVTILQLGYSFVF